MVLTVSWEGAWDGVVVPAQANDRDGDIASWPRRNDADEVSPTTATQKPGG
jgi:hypothetical protein